MKGSGELLSGPGRRDLSLRPKEKAVQVARQPPGQGIEHRGVDEGE